MKISISKILFSSITFTIYTSTSAQDTVPKKSHKEIIETGNGDKIEAKKIKEKQLNAAPAIIPQNDSVPKKKSLPVKKKKKSSR